MMLQIAVLLAILASPAYSTTDITNNNCPSNFNITQSNITVGIGTSALAKFFFSAYMSSSNKNTIQTYMVSSQSQQISNIATKQYIWPFVVITVVFGLTFAIVVLCVVFQKSCPPCQSWRRDFAKRPYQKFEMRCVAIFAIIFSVAILGTSVAAFTFIPQLYTHLQQTKCGIYGSIDVAVNGDSSNWGGFSHIKDQVGNISKLLNSTNTQINNYFVNNNALTNAMNQMKSDNANIYQTNKLAQVKTPDPYASPAAQTTNSYFVDKLLGPTTLNTTMAYDIESGLNITEQLSKQADAIIQSAYQIVQSASTIQSNTEASQQELTMYQNQLISFKVGIDKFSSNYFNPIFNWGVYVVEVVIGFVLVASIAVIIGSVSVHILDIYDCRYFLHFGWVAFGLTYFGVILTCFMLLPMGSMGYTFCDYYYGMLTTDTEFARIGDSYSQNPLSKLDICIRGNGNVLQKFNIENQMNTVSTMFTNIQLFQAYDDPTTMNYVNQSISTNKLADWITTLQSYKQGITKDVFSSISTQANAMISLAKLNSYSLLSPSNPSDGITRCTKDNWVFDAVDCPTSQYVFVPPATEAQGIALDNSIITCISFNSKLYQGSPNDKWTITDVMNRYKQIRGSCLSAYTKITEYANALIQYRDSRINLFQGFIDQLTSLQSSHYNFNVTLNTFRSTLSSFSSTQAITDLNNFVTNKIDGLLISSNCSPIGDHMWFVYNSFCVNSMGSAVQLGICMVVLLCLLIGGLFTACVFAQRAATIKRLHKIHQENFGKLEENSLHSQTFAKKQKSQSSDSSSDQD